MASFRRWIRQAAKVALAAGLGLVLCEALLALLAGFSPTLRYLLREPWRAAFVSDPELGRRLSPDRPDHDRRGYRNPPDLGPVQVLAVGDSLTYGYGVESADSWPRQLAALTGRAIYNAGVGGYGPCEYERVVDELLELRPRLVLVGLYLGNDPANAYTSAYDEDRQPRWRSRDPAVVEEIREANEAASLARRSARFEAGERSPAPPRRSGPRRWLASHSRLYGLGRAASFALERARARPSFERAAAKPFRLSFDADRRFRTVFRSPELDALAVDLDDPRIREGLRITFDVLRSLREGLGRRGVRLAVVVLHNKPYAYREAVRASGWEAPDAFLRLIEREAALSRRVEAFLEAEGIPYVDADPALLAAFERGERTFPESDDHHPNRAGYRAIAERARALLDPGGG